MRWLIEEYQKIYGVSHTKCCLCVSKSASIDLFHQNKLLIHSQESNFELNYVGQKRYGVVDGSGTTITYLGFNNKVDTLKWLSPEDVERLREARDSLEAPR